MKLSVSQTLRKTSLPSVMAEGLGSLATLQYTEMSHEPRKRKITT